MDVILGHLTPKQLQTHCTQALTAELKSCEDQLRLTLDAIQRLVSVRQAAAKLDVQGLDAKLKARVVRIDKLHKDVSAGINALMQDAGLAAASDAVQSVWLLVALFRALFVVLTRSVGLVDCGCEAATHGQSHHRLFVSDVLTHSCFDV